MKTQETPGEAVARLREAKGWTVYRLALVAGVGDEQIRRWEAGSDVRLATARKVFAALGDEGRQAWSAMLG